MGLHLVSSFSRVFCTSGGLLQQVGDDVICDVKELFVDLLILTEIVISGRESGIRIPHCMTELCANIFTERKGLSNNPDLNDTELCA